MDHLKIRRRRGLTDRQLLGMEGKPVFLRDINTWMLVCIMGGKAYLRAGDGSICSTDDHDVFPNEREAV